MTSVRTRLKRKLRSAGIPVADDATTTQLAVVLRLLDALKRCPGIHTTDQVTGMTYAEMLSALRGPSLS